MFWPAPQNTNSQLDQIKILQGRPLGAKSAIMRYLTHKIQNRAEEATIPTSVRKTFAENPGLQSQAPPPHGAYCGQHQTVEGELEALGTVGVCPMCLELCMLHCKAERNVAQDKRLGLRYSKNMLLNSSSAST